MAAVPDPPARRRRRVGRYLLVLALLLGAAVGYRAFAPREVLDPARSAYPPAAPATPWFYGAGLDMPLLVDGRLRVYATAREVWADQPADYRASRSPYWALRRWPAGLTGVAATGTTVVSRWSDGELVALDATRGRIAWRSRGPAVAAGYAGRRTGAATVYQPVGLYTAGPVLLVAGDSRVAAYQMATGRLLWTRPAPACRDRAYFSTATALVAVMGCGPVAAVDAVAAATGRRLDWPALGAATPADVTPVGCAVGRSGCAGVRTPGRAWVAAPDGGLTQAPALVDPGGWLVGDVVVAAAADGTVTGRAVGTGQPSWTWPRRGPVPAGTRILAVQPGEVHLLTADRYLITVDTANGLERCRIALIDPDNGRFDPGYVYAADRYVFIERLKPGARSGDPDSRYYYPSPAVLITGS